MGGALMPARSWIVIFALAGGSISLAIAVAGALGSTAWVLIFAGAGFVMTLVAATFAYHYLQMSEWDSATLADDLEAHSKTGPPLTVSDVPDPQPGPERGRSSG
jgi:hypothetical protein